MVRWPRLSWVFVGIVVTAMLSACGGGGTSSVGGGAVGTQSSTSSGSTSTTGSTTLTFSAISGVSSSSITIPAASGATTLNATLDTKIPAGVAAPSALTLKRSTQSIGGSDLTVYAVVALTVSGAVTLSESPSFSFTLSKVPSGTPYIAFFDENNAASGWSVLLGPGEITNRTVTFASQALVPPLSFVSNDVYLFALITTASAPTPGLAYSGTKSTNYTYNFSFNCVDPGCPGNTPAPLPAPTTLSYNVTTTVGAGSNAYPGTAPASGLVDESVSESDVSTLVTTSYTTDSWVGLSTASAPYSVNLYGTKQTEPSSDNLPVTTTIYGTPQTVDQFPQSSSITWTNAPAANIAYSYSDGSTGTRVIAADGTYVDTENLIVGGAGGTITTTENSDASGSIAGPLFSGLVSSLVFSAPSSGQINFTVNFTAAGQSEFGEPPSIPFGGDAQWFNTPPVFYTETDGMTLSASLPAGCTPNSFGSSATDVNRTINTLDTTLGFEETTILDSYEVNGVPICMTTSDTQNYAYDQQDNQPFTFILGGPLGLEVIATTEALVLQGSASTQSAARTTASLGSVSSDRAAVAAIQAHQLSYLAHARAVRRHTYLTTLRKQSAQSLRSIKGVR
ncbi:MAG TPA: hypothetical protein VGG22_11820 [Candidatus Baltobacteraceae bacterium]